MSDQPESNSVGKSLWSDAWQKLMRNRMAVVSMVVLALVGLGAFFTPLLPLQPSDRVITEQKFARPTFAAPEQPLGLTLDAIRDAWKESRDLKRQMFEENEEGWLTKEQNNRVRDTYIKPYSDAGFPPAIGFGSRFMIRTRLRIFDDYQIPSICGRDNLGRDVLARIFWGARVSLIVGIVATLVSLIIGVSYGSLSGYAGGWLDAIMMRIVDVLYSVPFIFVVIFLLTILGEESVKKQLESFGISRIVIFYLVVGAIYWLTMARVVRGQVLSLKHELFVEAARAQGASWPRIVALHLVPNVASVVIVYLTLTIPRVMLFEAFLSFLGLGVQSPDVSWGLLAKDGLAVITPLRIYWWLVVFPSFALGLTLFALNFFGDALRDALDPRLRSES